MQPNSKKATERAVADVLLDRKQLITVIGKAEADKFFALREGHQNDTVEQHKDSDSWLRKTLMPAVLRPGKQPSTKLEEQLRYDVWPYLRGQI